MDIWNVIKGWLSGGEATQAAAQGSNASAFAQNATKCSSLERAFQDTLCKNDSRCQFDAANHLLENEEYGTAIKAYKELAQKHQDERHLCEARIGDAYAKQRKFFQAIEYYNAARIHGACEGIMDDNIWQACLNEYRITRNTAPFAKYLTLFPRGKYVEIATQYLEKQKARAHSE